MTISLEAIAAAFARDTDDNAVIDEQPNPAHREEIGRGVITLMRTLEEIRLTELVIAEIDAEIDAENARIKDWHKFECLDDGLNELNDNQLRDYEGVALLRYKRNLMEEKLRDLRNRPQ